MCVRIGYLTKAVDRASSVGIAEDTRYIGFSESLPNTRAEAEVEVEADTSARQTERPIRRLAPRLGPSESPGLGADQALGLQRQESLVPSEGSEANEPKASN